ncbi:MAG: 3-oxoacyl-ACP reductase FabG [Betaproteobacteria bacterium]
MRRALVSGGSGGIGAAICKRLAADGCHVYVHANAHGAAAQRVVETIRVAGGTADVVTFDVTDAHATSAALATLLDHGAIQIVVNNAGIHDDAVFPAMRNDQWHRVIDVSLHGFFNVTQPLTLQMIRQRWGRIINIASVSAISGNRGQVNYSAAKGALVAATRSLSIELASRGVTVNAVAPGIIETTMTDGKQRAAIVERMVPMQRMGQPSEVADLVGFLASDRAAYITGQVISINGGML